MGAYGIGHTLRSRSRGIRLPEQTSMQIIDIASNLKVPESRVIVKMTELGLTFYESLPLSMRAKLWKKQNFNQQQKTFSKLQDKAQILIKNLKLNSPVAFRIPAERRRILQAEARRSNQTLSEFLRGRIVEAR